MASSVTEIAPAPSTEGVWCIFSRSLMFETDCSDTHEAISSGRADFVSSTCADRQPCRRPRARSRSTLPHGKITERRYGRLWPRDTGFVTYCAGPHCNGAARGAIRPAELGRPVKIMDGRHHRMARRGFELEVPHEPVRRATRTRWIRTLPGYGSGP